MEILESRSRANLPSLLSFENPAKLWNFAYQHVNDHRYDELDRIWGMVVRCDHGHNVSIHYFLREYVWCVLVSGFSAKVISKKITPVLKAHNIEDESGQYVEITENNLLLTDAQLTEFVFPVYKNKNKARAIQKTRQRIHKLGWEGFKTEFFGVGTHPGPSPTYLQRLPFMGPALSKHLARNLGNQRAVKPDKHLVRLAERHGLLDAQRLCEECCRMQPPGFVDLILWMAATDCGTL